MDRLVRHLRAWRAGLALAAAVGATLPAVASADVGAGVGATPITLDAPAIAGGTYSLPSLLVINTGSEPAGYAVRVERLAPGNGLEVPATWVRLQRVAFQLQPKEATQIGLRLVVPTDATPGDYESDLVASTVIPRRAGPAGASLGVQAATKLSFRVVRDGGGFAIPWPWPLWSYLAIGFIVALGAAGILGIRIEVVRRR